MTKSVMNVDWRNYLDSSNPLIDEYISSYGNKFIIQTLRKIKTAHSRGANKIILIRFQGSNIISILYKKDYINALDMLLTLCIKLEFYEICSDIKKTIKKVKGGVSKTKLATH